MVLSACSAWPAHLVVVERGRVALSLCMNPLLMVCVAAMRHIKQMFITVRQCPLTVEEREERPAGQTHRSIASKVLLLTFSILFSLDPHRFTKLDYQINAVNVLWPNMSYRFCIAWLFNRASSSDYDF